MRSAPAGRVEPQLARHLGRLEAPADRLGEARRRRARRRRGGAAAARRVSRPLAPCAGSVAGSFSSPHSRATSSIRSTSRVTSLRRNAGTVTSSPSPVSMTPKSERARAARPARPAGPRCRAGRVTFSSRSRSVFGVRARPADVDRAVDQPRAGQLEHQLRGDRLAVHRLLGREALLEARRTPPCAGRAAATCAAGSARSSWPPPSARAWWSAGPRSAGRP